MLRFDFLRTEMLEAIRLYRGVSDPFSIILVDEGNEWTRTVTVKTSRNDSRVKCQCPPLVAENCEDTTGMPKLLNAVDVCEECD